jgi:signal peptidase I
MAKAEGRFYSYVFDVVVAFAIVILLFNFGNYFSVSFPVTGISMTPAIVSGDLALVQPVNISTVKVGDVIVYRDGGIDVIHRVVSIGDEGGTVVLVVKGDNNPAPDPVHPTSDLLVGKVVFVVKYFGHLVTYPFNYLLAVLLVSLLAVDYMGSAKAKAPSRPAQPPVSPPAGAP